MLIMPAFHSAAISTKMLQELGDATVLGPLIVGLDKPIQIVQLGATDTEIRQYGGDRRLRDRGMKPGDLVLRDALCALLRMRPK